MNKRLCLGVIVIINVGITATALMAGFNTQQATGFAATDPDARKAPAAVTGDNVYAAWWSNKTGNEEVLFRASADKGETFGDKINLSNTTDADSTRAEIDADANNVVVTWWETNETSDVPVMKVSTDNGKTFGEILKLAANGTIGE